MAKRLQRQHSGDTDRLKVWTFCIVGGEPFQLSLPGNPALEHDGHRTLWHLAGTQEMANQAEQLLKDTGAQITVHAEFETEEQYKQRHTPRE